MYCRFQKTNYQIRDGKKSETSLEAGGEQHFEAEEIWRSSGGFRPRRSRKLHALCFSFAFGETSVQSGELTVAKPRKIIRKIALLI